MSTRGAVGFHVHGIDKITYNHSDSYPSGLGQDVLDFLTKYLRKGTVSGLRKKAAKIEIIDDSVRATPEQQIKYREYADTGVSTGDLAEWYVLLRNLQGDLKGYLDAGVIVDGSDFLKDSLFCEWAYIINLDDETLEVYRGFNKKPNGKGRYAKGATLPPPDENGYKYEYYPVTLYKKYNLDNLPEEIKNPRG